MNDRTRTPLSPPTRLVLGVILAALAAGLLAGGIPIALRAHLGEVAEYCRSAAWLVTAGKILGLMAGTLVLLQFALSAKIQFLDRVFALHRLLSGHRLLGFSAAALASLHPLFIFAPKAKEIGTLRLAIWAELVGAVLLIGLWTAVYTGLWREFLRLPYGTWYRMHRLGTFSAVVLLTIHVMNVSHDFEQGWPLYASIVALGLYVALFVWAKVVKPSFVQRRTYEVTNVAPAGRDTYAVELAPEEGEVFPYAPGQFAFVTFRSRALPVEQHPWTISSTPTRPKSLIFTIKCTGDFTALIGRLKPADTAGADGPYGLFTHLAHVRDPKREIVMVAGGVGVTPMLSMLRYMADTDDTRKVTLVWSNRTEADILCREEIGAIDAKLPNLAVHHVLSRKKDFPGPTGRLDAAMLEDLLSGCSREAAVFVCGPPTMMDAVRRALKRIGFKGRFIHTERFSL